jgi:WD40 repeat protein
LPWVFFRKPGTPVNSELPTCPVPGAHSNSVSLEQRFGGEEAKRSVTVLSRDRTSLGIVGEDGRAHVFIDGNRSPAVFEIDRRDPTAGSFAFGNRVFVLGFGDGTFVLYNIGTGQREVSGNCMNDRIKTIFGLIDKLIMMTNDGHICSADNEGNIVGQADRVDATAEALSPDERMLATAGVTGEISLLEVDNLEEITRFEGHRGSVEALHFTLDGSDLVSGGADETLRVWPASQALYIATTSIENLRRDYPWMILMRGASAST